MGNSNGNTQTEQIFAESKYPTVACLVLRKMGQCGFRIVERQPSGAETLVAIYSDDLVVVSEWRRLGRTLGLPLACWMPDGRIELFESAKAIPASRRGGSSVRRRRPRFLQLRRM